MRELGRWQRSCCRVGWVVALTAHWARVQTSPEQMSEDCGTRIGDLKANKKQQSNLLGTFNTRFKTSSKNEEK